MEKIKKNIGILEILSASFIFGFIPIVVRFIEGVNIYEITFYKSIVAVLSLYLFIIFTKKKLIPLKFELKKMFLFGGLHGFIFLTYYYAILTLSISLAVLLLYTSSIWMVFFSYFILKHKISKKIIVSLLIGVIGLVFILNPFSFNKVNFLGVIIGLLGGVGFGLVYVLSTTFKKYDKVSLTFWQNLISIPFIFPLIFVEKSVFNLSDISLIFLLGSLFTALPFVLVYNGFQKVSAQIGAIFILFDIVFPIIFGFIFFSEIPLFNEIVGGILIILSSYLVMRK